MADFRTSQATVFKLVRDTTAEIPAKREKLKWGYNDEVYRVITHENTRYIVRIRHEGDVPLAQEAWALEQAYQVGAPVTKVLQVGDRVIDGLPREVLLQEDQTGVPLDTLLPKLSPEQQRNIFHQAGKALAKIHRIPVGGFHRRHAGGSWDFYTWDDLLCSAIRDYTAETATLTRAGVPAEEITIALNLLEQYRTDFAEVEPVLCHGDFHPAHLLADTEGNLTGIMNLGDFQGAHPIHDIAYFSLTSPQIPLDWLKSGYGSPTWWEDSTFPQRLRLHQVLIILGYLVHYIREDYEEADTMRTALSWVVREL